jgi:hypothetical protein
MQNTDIAVVDCYRLFTHLLLLAGATFTLSKVSNTAYDATGSIIGDFSAIEAFPSKVVLSFLASCSDTSIPTLDGCLVTTFADLRVPLDFTSPLDVTNAQILASASTAQELCNASMEEMQELVDSYQRVVASNCLFDLWYADSHLLIESTWINTCADTELPYPIPFESTRSTITLCMLQYIFEVSPTVFGLDQPGEGSPESCFPPGYEAVASICPTILAPRALRNCLNQVQQHDELAMSMDFREPNANHTLYISEFCNILEDLSSEVGRRCLLDLCHLDSSTPASDDIFHEGSPSLSSVPSSSPSLPPSDTPAPTPAPSTGTAQNDVAPITVAAPVTPSPTTTPTPIAPGPHSVSPPTDASVSPIAGADFPSAELDMFDWDLERTGPVTVVFANEEEEIKLSYNISLRTAVVRIFAGDCLNPVALDAVAVSLESNTTSSTHGQLDVELDINQTAVVGSNIWLDGSSTKEGFIDLCIRVDLVLDNDEQTSVTFHEQRLYLTIGLSQGFSVSQIGLYRDEAETEKQDVELAASLTACHCNAAAVCVEEVLTQGSDVYVCVFSDPDTDFVISAVEELEFVQESLRILAIDNSTNDELTSVLSVGETAIIRTQMRSDFFIASTLGPVVVTGSVSLIFGGTPGRRLRATSTLRGSDRRDLQREETALDGAEFKFRIYISPAHPALVTSNVATVPRDMLATIVGTVGGIVGIALLVVALVFRKKKKNEVEVEEEHATAEGGLWTKVGELK